MLLEYHLDNVMLQQLQYFACHDGLNREPKGHVHFPLSCVTIAKNDPMGKKLMGLKSPDFNFAPISTIPLKHVSVNKFAHSQLSNTRRITGASLSKL